MKGTRDDVKNAMGMTGSDQWVDRLPQKWETVFDGENLSGGEIQKVMAARALMKKRSVIFMDEPMASLDRKAAQFFAVELFRAGYVWNFNEGEEDKVKQAVAVLAEDLNANENIQENPFEIPDLSDKDAAAFPYRYEWQLRDFPQGHIELGIFKIKEDILVQVTAGIS